MHMQADVKWAVGVAAEYDASLPIISDARRSCHAANTPTRYPWMCPPEQSRHLSVESGVMRGTCLAGNIPCGIRIPRYATMERTGRDL